MANATTPVIQINEGNVGIGTTTPLAKLDIQGTQGQLFSVTDDLSGSIFAVADISGVPIFDVNSSGVSYFDGNVGIGTDSPVSPLTIKSSSTSSGESGLTIQANANTNAIVKLGEKGGDGGRLEMLDGGVSKIALYTDGTDNYINSGNVGIGTTSPDYPLDVSGLTRSSSGFSADGNARIVNWEGSNTGGTAAIKLIATYSNVAQGDRIKIEAVGNVSYSAGIDAVVSTIALQMNNNSVLEGSWWQEGNSTVFTTTGGASVFVKTVATGTYQIFVRAGQYSSFAFTASCNSGTIVPSWTTYTSTITNTNDIDKKWNVNNALYEDGGEIGIGDSTPSYKLDVNGTIRATGDVIAYSDARVKDNVVTINNALDKVTKLRGVSYTRNDVEDETTKIGVIAQEVLEVLPEVVQQDGEGKYSVAYGNMVGLLIESIKELKAEIDELKSRL